MGARLAKDKIPVPLSIQASTIDEVLVFCKTHELLPSGIVIKPLNSAGTDSVSACFDEASIRNAMQKSIGEKNLFNHLNEKMFVQEFLAGVEYVVDTASFAGKHTVTDICRYTKIQENGSQFVYDCLDFLPPEGNIQKELSEYIFNVLDSLGIQYGPAHSEVMLTQKGPRLIETGARVHGGIGVSACRFATGSSHLDLTLSLLLKKIKISMSKINYTIKQATKIVFLISHFDSLVKAEHSNMAILKNLPSLQLLKLNIQPSDKLKKTVDLFTMPGLLILSHSDEKQVENDYQTIRQLEREGLFVM